MGAPVRAGACPRSLLLDAYSPRGVLGAGASRLAEGVRRKRSGAFAAELLMPRSGIEGILGGRDPADGQVFAELIKHFAIGASAAAYQLWNEGFLISTADRDFLIEEYASEPGKA